VLVGLIIIAVTYPLLLKEQKLKVHVNYTFVEGDLKYTPKVMFSLAVMTFFVGFSNACAGVAPGIFLQVIMISMGLHPLVSERTCNYIACSVSCTAGISAIYYKQMPYDYALAFSLISMFATA